MSCARGGDLLNLVIENVRIKKEAMIRTYTAEIMIGLKGLHDQDIAYRDLKLENVLLDENGHCLLTDFGVSKQNINQKSAKTRVGSNTYMAPEVDEAMYEGKYDGKLADIYSLGCVVYVLLTGKDPKKQKFKPHLGKKNFEYMSKKNPKNAPSAELVDLIC